MGERQLVAMARGLLFDPPFLLLDEATAHVDSLTLELIQKGLDVLSEDRTVLVAAHRLSTVRHLDRILVFHQGRIVESGRHRELMARKGIYHQLYQSDLVVE
jgi:ATP-binding cassette subfamily B protein